VENPERRSGTIWVLFEKHSSYFDPEGNKNRVLGAAQARGLKTATL
jgi:hypothetical protein